MIYTNSGVNFYLTNIVEIKNSKIAPYDPVTMGEIKGNIIVEDDNYSR